MRPALLFLFLASLLLSPALFADQDPLEEAAQIRDSRPAEALELARDSLEESLNAGDERRASLARLEMAHALEVLGGHEDALALLDDVDAYLESADKPGQQAESLKLRGTILYHQGRHDLALQSFQRAHAYHEGSGDIAGMAEALNQIGRVHDAQGASERALDYYQRSMNEHERAGNLEGMATQLNNIGTIQRQQGDVEGALAAYLESIDIRERTGNLRDMAGTYSNIAVLHHFEGEAEESLRWIRDALDLYEEVGDRMGLARTQLNMAQILRQQDRLDEAMDYFQASLEVAEEQDALDLKRVLYDNLSSINEEQGDLARALEFSRKSAEVRAELFDTERQREIEVMNARFETSRKEREIALLQEERRFDTLVRNTAISGSLLMLVLIGVTYNRYRVKLRSNRTIQKKNEELATLDSIVAAINSREDFHDVLAILLQRSIEFFRNAGEGAVLILNPLTKRFEVASQEGKLSLALDQSQLDFDAAVERYTHGGEEIAEDIYLHAPAPGRPLSMVAMTLMIDRTIQGFLLLANAEDRKPFQPADAERFARIREHAVSALTRARHMEHLKEENLRAEEAICRLRIAERNLKQAAEEAEKANAIKSQFLARMSHELRTPLNAIIGYSEMLTRELENTRMTGFVTDIQRIRSAGQHLLTLINELLDLSRIEAGKTDIRGSAVPVRELLDDVAGMTQPQLEENGNRLHIDYPEDPTLEITSDPTRLRQILFNLVANAIKFTENGDIHLSAERETDSEGENILFRVKDNGIGMTAAQMDRVFDSFAQADESISRRFGGTGLGLAVSRGLCQLLGGDISVESEAGKGSLFTVRLPLHLDTEDRDAVTKETPETPEEAAEGKQAGRMILIVEDNEINSDMLVRHLELEGYRTLLARDGEEGLDLAQRHVPDLVLMDMGLPGMDGWETTRRLKAESRTAHIPVIGLSAHAMKSHRIKALDAGCDEYENKPIDFGRLFEKVKRLLDRK